VTSGYCQLISDSEAMALTCTEVGDAWTEMTSEVGTLSLYECFKGRVIRSYCGSHGAGSGMARVRNILNPTVPIKMLEPLPIVTEERVRYLKHPFIVEEGDILEEFHAVVPT